MPLLRHSADYVRLSPVAPCRLHAPITCRAWFISKVVRSIMSGWCGLTPAWTSRPRRCMRSVFSRWIVSNPSIGKSPDPSSAPPTSPNIYRRLRDDPGLHYLDAETLVADASAALAKAVAASPAWFGTLPQAPCVANSIEQGALAFYSRPARDGSKPGRFFFNTVDPSMWGTFQLEAVTYHEGVPGHHLQLAIAQENPELHHLLADYYIAAYNEGWGLYTERLADEMGLYSTELDRVGMLSADSMRACRLVVDTGIHAFGWTRDQAIDYMLDHSPMTRTQVEGEIDRYIGDPGQALGYMLGRLEFERIRNDAESRLADRFGIKDFHDVVLSTGSVPISTLRRVVNDWVERIEPAPS